MPIILVEEKEREKEKGKSEEEGKGLENLDMLAQTCINTHIHADVGSE